MVRLFTHTDLDGVGCAVLMKLMEETGRCRTQVEYCRYDNINQRVEKFLNEGSDDICFITDISVNDEIAERIDKESKNKAKFALFDHHASALGLNKYGWCTVKVDVGGKLTCGTELFYNFLLDPCFSLCKRRTKSLDRFVSTVRAYDTWDWVSMEDGEICKKTNDLLYLYGREKFVDWAVSLIKRGLFPVFSETEEALLAQEQKKVDEYVEEKDKQIVSRSICGYQCGIVFADKYFSELGNRLCSLHPELDIVAMVDMGSKVVSYRTQREDIDLGNGFAKRFGGGGHAMAAGSTFDDEVQGVATDNIFRGWR